ncbi:hypothetical protein RIB2604_01500010 [Aspergillus luchuensis]|uniref:GXWXG domain-containing protein n=1 Tax=Aspergillus kawachii TaxID=1069201 RepID=A0A146F8M0_ASPKA|nr:hypothetical protein RIB2604_01500010 [Aspergillus luchuensis]
MARLERCLALLTEVNTFSSHLQTGPVEEYFLSLIKEQESFDSRELQNVFDHLPGVQPDVLLGEWEVHLLRTGHPSDLVAERLLPLIKVVHSRTSVTKYSLAGNTRKSLPDWGDMFVSL